jgi:hypothetical protein
MKRLMIFGLLSFMSLFLTAQVSSIATYEICAAQEVFLPVNGQDLFNVGAITLYLSFDTLNLVYQSVENIDPQLSGVTVNLMTNPIKLAFAWSNPVAVNFLNTKLFEIKFTSNGNPGLVTFSGNCEISDTNGIPLNVNYLDGGILSGVPEVLQNPSDTTIVENNDAAFFVSALNCSEYIWRESEDNGNSWLVLDDGGHYSGTKTDFLTLTDVPIAFNNRLYQCVLESNSCQVVTLPGKLFVDQFVTTESSRKRSLISDISLSPVPCHNFLNLSFICMRTGMVECVVYNAHGALVKSLIIPVNLTGNQYIRLDLHGLPEGFYLLKLQFPDRGISNATASFLIRNN